jgi:flagellar hook protein FlgE
MTLFGALSSGVSGLTAQSSAMGAISDNITNVSTVGYKNTQVDFQTLVTTQTSTTFYSAGGVQSKPRQDTGVQGLLASSTSQTDIALSGQGFFVVNESNTPSINNEFLFTRAGSFFQDNDGFLRNTSGFYLQGWPTTAAGVVKPNNDQLTIPNQNVISTDYLATINLNRVGGTATSTSNIGIGANLPSNDSAGTTHKTDVQFFDSLGNANTMSVIYEKTSAENEWKMRVEPPPGTTHITMESSTLNPKVYRSIGQLEFNKTDSTGAAIRPADGASVTIGDGTTTKTYVFDSNASVTNPVAQTSTLTITTAVAAAVSWDINGTTVSITGTAGDLAATAADMAAAINASVEGPNSANADRVVATSSAGVVTITSVNAGTAHTILNDTFAGGGAGADAPGTANAGTTNTFQVDISASSTLAADVSALLTSIQTNDPNFNTTNNRVKVSAGSSTTLLFEDDGLDQIVINPTGLKASSGVSVTDQTVQFTVSRRDTAYTDYTQLKFTSVPATGETIIINGTTYTFTTGEAADSTGANTTIYRDGPLDQVLADLEAAIEANDANYAGATVYLSGTNQPANDTLIINSLADGTAYTISGTAVTNNVIETDGTTPAAATGVFTTVTPHTISVGTDPALSFSADGLPNGINVVELDIRNFSNGAANMDDDASNASQITMDFGTVAEANGMTQFGASFTPVFINQNGSQFGTFAGVTINTSGLVTALFDNGETRPVYQLPVATFTNVNSLGNRTGNVWNSTEASGDPTLRTADNGPAGQVVQASLEQSTVDIGEEFTKMIVVQRAFSASAKIISTADEMLEELLRTKR